MLYTVEDDLKLCIDLKISAQQLMFLKMLVPDPTYESSDLKRRNYRWCLEFANELGGLEPDDLADLISREYLIDLNEPGRNLHDYYELSNNALSKLRKSLFGMPWELHEAYPHFLSRPNAQGQKLGAKTCTENEIARAYLKAINNNEKEHELVLEDVKWAIKNNAIVMGLKKFVDSRHWKAIRELRRTNKTSFDNVRLGQ